MEHPQIVEQLEMEHFKEVGVMLVVGTMLTL